MAKKNKNKSKNHKNEVPDQPVKKLIIAVSLAAVAGILILLLQILPAQFGIDPTGFGEYIGLTKRYETKKYYEQLKNTTEQQQTQEIEILPGEELEYKLYMLEGDQVDYDWTASGGEIFSEFHGEPQGIHGGAYKSYSIGTLEEDSGSFTAPFEGTHGWYWRNTSDTPVAVTLKTNGKYSNVGVKAAAFTRE